MKKIQTLFVRDHEGTRRLFDQVTPGCEWVLAGEGVATRKYDGTACLVEGGKLWKRREIKSGQRIPDMFREEQHDPTTGKRFGWVLVDLKSSENKHHLEAFAPVPDGGIGLRYAPYREDGTYELIGPKVQGGFDSRGKHELIRHGITVLEDVTDRTHAGLRAYLESHMIEGIVFHHPDGRMAKVKRRDFGLAWPLKQEGIPINLIR